jgi:hypothetical protein
MLFVNPETTPSRAALIFFLFLSLPLLVWGFAHQPASSDPNYLTFQANLSWVVSILILFPVIVGFSITYYRGIPQLFDYLFELTGQADTKSLKSLAARLNSLFNSRAATMVSVTIAALLNTAMVYQILNQGFTGWMTDGTILSRFSSGGAGLSALGVCALLVQIMITYGLLNLVWRGFVMTWGIYKLLRTEDFQTVFQPAHSDRLGGFGVLGSCLMRYNLIMFVLGIYVSLKVADKIVIQGVSLLSDIGSLTLLAAFFILSPILFVLPLYLTHQHMRRQKDRIMQPAAKIQAETIASLATASAPDDYIGLMETSYTLEKFINVVSKKIPVWPVDFRSTAAIFAVLMPVGPVLFPFVVTFFSGA